jgi:hypothetical protein
MREFEKREVEIKKMASVNFSRLIKNKKIGKLLVLAA